MDPAQANEGSNFMMFQAVYDTLLRRMPDGELVPMLATDWEVAEDGLSVTLTLRDDITFSDGSKFDSSVVKANLDRFEGENGPQAATMSALASVDTPDATTVVLNLEQPDPAIPLYLANVAGLMASAEALKDPMSLATMPVGTGPYTLDAANTSVGVKYTYQRKDDYWGEPLPFATFVSVLYPDQQAMLNALRSGQINATSFFAPAEGVEAENAGFTYWPAETDYQGLVIFDRAGDKIPALGDVRVRQAINYAIDRELLLKTFILDRGTVTTQIWGTSSAGFDKALDNRYPYDPAKAKALLAEAGYADGFDIEMPTVPQFDPTMMAAIVQMLNDVGIRATIKDIPFPEFFPGMRSGEFPLTYMRFFQPSDWQLVTQFIAPDAVWNGFGSEDPTVSTLIEELRFARGDENVGPAQELNKFIVEDAWFAPFYRTENQTFSDPSIVVVPQAEQAAPSIYNFSPKK
ncbi:MAG: ABC transporter substrate-binding protein [Candidatus Nanopelagicales bacterium]